MKKAGSQIVSICLILLLLVSCSNRREGFKYVSIGPEEGDRVFIFDFPMDSGIVYDTYIACRLDPLKIEKTTLKLHLTAIDPNGDCFSEEVDFPIVTNPKEPLHKDISIRQSLHAYDIEWPYRFDVKAGETPGLWKLCIKIMDRQADGAVYGIGFTYNGKNNERKRQN